MGSLHTPQNKQSLTSDCVSCGAPLKHDATECEYCKRVVYDTKNTSVLRNPWGQTISPIHQTVHRDAQVLRTDNPSNNDVRD